MTIKLFNTLTKKKEELVTREPNKVSMYVCGPTTYNYIHLGNARPIVVFDTIRRYLTYRGYEVIYVQNFTDVDDKIIKRAREEKETPANLAQKYIDAYFKDADALNILRANVYPRVTEHMAEIINMVKVLVEKGYAYEACGDVYFDVRKFIGYGKLSGRSLEDMKAGARVEIGDIKKYPLDFALWKNAKPEEPCWESPWGKGRPGWHIECSTMSLKYLTDGFDIHGGGADLIFPHHENEIAQAEAFSGKTFAKYWLHNGFITVNQEKMSKSLGNFFLVKDILDKFSSDVVRFYLLSTHYRSPLDFDDQKLHVAEKGLERIRTSLRLAQDTLAFCMKADQDGQVPEAETLIQVIKKIKNSFIEAMDDDFNTALAIAALFDLCREVNGFINESSFVPGKKGVLVLQQVISAFDEFDAVLGTVKPLEKSGTEDQGMEEKLMEIIIDIRKEARKRKDWITADLIRDRLKEIGIKLEDTPHGVRWQKIEVNHG
jgi:cysteinyl-tRNA synthetase